MLNKDIPFKANELKLVIQRDNFGSMALKSRQLEDLFFKCLDSLDLKVSQRLDRWFYLNQLTYILF